MKCKICEIEDEIVNENNPLCDGCWYGMRLDPEEWKKRLNAKGIEIERGIGCNIIPGVGFACGDPYKKKNT